MLTAKQVSEIKPLPFQPVLSYTRFKDGTKVWQNHPSYSPPRYKREWSFEGTHEVPLKDGTKERRQGQYVLKMRRP